MRYHYEKPTIYSSMYGKLYFCEHPVYSRCTLFEIDKKGLAIIQQRFEEETKSTSWTDYSVRSYLKEKGIKKTIKALIREK